MLLWKENTKQRELLEAKKKRKKGEQGTIEGKFIFNVKEILSVVQEAEAEAEKQKGCNQQHERSQAVESKDSIEDVLENYLSEIEASCIVVVQRR